MFSLIPARVATRIGIVGAVADCRPLFTIAAEEAEAATGARLRLIWLAGPNTAQLDARLIVEGSAAILGKCAAETTVRLEGSSRDDIPAISKALIELIQLVS